VPTKTVLKVGFLERHFERDHLAEKSNRTKMGQKIHCAAELIFLRAFKRFTAMAMLLDISFPLSVQIRAVRISSVSLE
jgi:hypothetical protein